MSVEEARTFLIDANDGTIEAPENGTSHGQEK